MSWLSRRLGHRPAPRSRNTVESRLGTELASWIERLALPCAAIGVGVELGSSSTSSIGGHPYLPMGEKWPTVGGRPALFVCQINFADVPPLPGFPQSGLLQWFVGDNDTLGLTFDESGGRAGFATRWYPDPSEPSLQPPDARTSHVERSGVVLGRQVRTPIPLVFAAGRCLPAWAELSPDVRSEPVWLTLAQARGELPEDIEFTYMEYVRGVSGPALDLVHSSKIGGSASFSQDDPRGTMSYPPLGDPAGHLIVELDQDLLEWGDGGVGHVFGDPAAVAVGDLRSLRYHWDCC